MSVISICEIIEVLTYVIKHFFEHYQTLNGINRVTEVWWLKLEYNKDFLNYYYNKFLNFKEQFIVNKIY